MAEFTHLDRGGNPAMADVGSKKVTRRKARAQAVVTLPAELMAELAGKQFTVQKGSIFQTAILAGIQAAKKTGELIPLCHNLALDNCKVQIDTPDAQSVRIVCEVAAEGKTGVEMEALTGAAVAALTVYDMCKAFSQQIEINGLVLLEKTGGKNDYKRQ
jgi:cyclic pyranopterin monophosphate synthase